MKKLLAALALSLVALLVTLPLGALAEIPPVPENANTYVFDYTSDAVMTAQDMAEMNAYAEALEDKTGAQAVTVLVDFLDGEDIELYAYDLFQAWNIGKTGKNNGVLLLFSRGDRDVTIMPGTGLERTLSGSVSGQILDDNAIPALRNNNYSAGLRAAFVAMCERIAKAENVQLSVASSRGSRNFRHHEVRCFIRKPQKRRLLIKQYCRSRNNVIKSGWSNRVGYAQYWDVTYPLSAVPQFHVKGTRSTIRYGYLSGTEAKRSGRSGIRIRVIRISISAQAASRRPAAYPAHRANVVVAVSAAPKPARMMHSLHICISRTRSCIHYSFGLYGRGLGFSCVLFRARNHPYE